jgi:hypothetical protein
MHHVVGAPGSRTTARTQNVSAREKPQFNSEKRLQGADILRVIRSCVPVVD